MKKAKKIVVQTNIVNKTAFFSYQILDKYTAGLVLKGTEVKSIRMGQANIKETYCYFANHELWVKGMHISTYQAAAKGKKRHDKRVSIKQRDIERSIARER